MNTVIVDEHGEFEELTKSLGGKYVKIRLGDSNVCINPFQLQLRKEYDKFYLDINSKVENIVNLLMLMIAQFKNDLSSYQLKILSIIVFATANELYKVKEITEDINSLYVNINKKQMPTIRDLYDLINHYASKKGIFTNELEILLHILSFFQKDEIYGIFDGQTSFDFIFQDYPLVTFDVSELDGCIKPICDYIIFTYIWENFIDNVEIQSKKRVIYYEVNGLSRLNASFEDLLMNISRGARLRNTGITIAYQGASHNNTTLRGPSSYIFLRQNIYDTKYLQNNSGKFHNLFLTEDDLNFIASANRGEMLISLGNGDNIRVNHKL